MMRALTMMLCIGVSHPLIAVAFQLNAPLPCASKSNILSIDSRRRHNKNGHHNGNSISLFVHFDDFSDIMLNGEAATNGEVNGKDLAIEIPPSSSDFSSFPKLQSTLASPPTSYPPSTTFQILKQFTSSGFLNDNDIIQFARGFVSREEVLSQILIQDFGWNALDAHRARVGVISLVREELGEIVENRHHDVTSIQPANNEKHDGSIEQALPKPKSERSVQELSLPSSNNKPKNKKGGQEEDATNTVTENIKPMLWKSVLVNNKAKGRRGKDNKKKSSSTNNKPDSSDSISTGKDTYNYGLLKDTNDGKDRRTYGNLYAELDNFWLYMTIPQTSAVSDPPIREQTANVYMTHARLFLGWVVDARDVLSDTDLLEELQQSVDTEEDAAAANAPSNSSPLASQLSGMALLQSTTTSSTNNAKSVRMNTWKHVQERILSSSSSSDTKLPQTEKDYIKQNISLYDVFPSSQTESAAPILQYVLWLRSERRISPNYEANILRGLIKLVKFRFVHDISSSSSSSLSNPSGNKNNIARSNMATPAQSTPLDNLPIVIELRKLHREAGSKGKKAPRSSDEGKKWLEWSEYLDVIQLLKSDLSEMIEMYQRNMDIKAKDEETQSSNDQRVDTKAEKKKLQQTLAKMKSLKFQRKEIATKYQHYLILSFFACVPDRQRTYRELQLNRNFIKVEDEDGSSMWVIKHTAEDYKTGATYGERPPLPLTLTLTPDIDDFIDQWRPALLHKSSKESDDGAGDDADGADPTSYLFLQPRTGNPLTANSVYQIVSRCCYKYKQKKTNPHLLRDMIVTHVRKNGDASEKELEALALFMGHSIQMQRDSYDRRTLEQKVSPAVKLMQNMNSLGNDMSD